MGANAGVQTRKFHRFPTASAKKNLQLLRFRAELYQTIVQLADRWYPSSKRCSHCGTIKEALNLNDRAFECGICDFKLDCDQNAAKNLYQLSVDKSLNETLGFSTASSAGFEACGEEGAGSSIVV